MKSGVDGIFVVKMSGKRVLALFDVDGTLTEPRKVCSQGLRGSVDG